MPHWWFFVDEWWETSFFFLEWHKGANIILIRSYHLLFLEILGYQTPETQTTLGVYCNLCVFNKPQGIIEFRKIRFIKHRGIDGAIGKQWSRVVFWFNITRALSLWNLVRLTMNKEKDSFHSRQQMGWLSS